MNVKIPLSLSAALLWTGFVGAISFMEAWLKFRAPGVTLPLGLGIGRIVFAALNKAEWVFAISMILSFLITKAPISRMEYALFAVPFVILLLQTFWLLPALDLRAETIIRGGTPAPSVLHLTYVGMELLKVISLIIFSVKQFR